MSSFSKETFLLRMLTQDLARFFTVFIIFVMGFSQVTWWLLLTVNLFCISRHSSSSSKALSLTVLLRTLRFVRLFETFLKLITGNHRWGNRRNTLWSGQRELRDEPDEGCCREHDHDLPDVSRGVEPLLGRLAVQQPRVHRQDAVVLQSIKKNIY